MPSSRALTPTGCLSRGVGGTGLGLYIAKQLIEQMNGRLTLRSTEGSGSTFAIELPEADSDVSGDSAAGRSAGPERGKAIAPQSD
jgi:signal transduction histidine kinase